MKIAIIGSRGQLGRELCRQLGAQAIGLSREQLDITDAAAVLSVLRRLAPGGVVNAAGYTAVDKAENDAAACHAINATAVEHLAAACRELDCPLVQISTDYVFGHDRQPRRPWREDDPLQPRGVYAQSKFAGERAAQAIARHFVVRTCGLYGLRTKPTQGNFVDSMLRLGRERDSLRVVGDQHCTPTYVQDLAAAVRFLLGTAAYGTYHVVNQGETTWHQFAAEILKIVGISVKLERITTAEYGAPAPRPAYSVLDTGKYHALGGPVMSGWQDALALYLSQIGAASIQAKK